ncbi:MAG: hypothetical protein WBQ32_14580, partial [Ignavibacteriaceae bacterium]
MKKIFFTILFVISSVHSFAQQPENLEIITDKGAKNIPAWLREGIIYISIADLAEALSINYYESESTGKVELKSNYFLLKSTPGSPYLILTSRSTGIPKVYQLPKSSYVKNSKTYIPLTYSLRPLEVIVERKLKFENPDKLIVGIPIKSPSEGQDWMFDNPDLPPTTGYGITGLTITEKVNGTLI